MYAIGFLTDRPTDRPTDKIDVLRPTSKQKELVEDCIPVKMPRAVRRMTNNRLPAKSEPASSAGRFASRLAERPA
jgi:hypothetical protein